MDVHESKNDGIEFTLAGRKFRVKRLSVAGIFAETQEQIKKEFKDDVIEMAKSLPEKDRVEFTIKAMRDMPKGRVLDALVNDRNESISGGLKILFKALNTCQEVSMEDCIALSTDNHAEEAIAIINYALGLDYNSDVVTKEQKDEEEKKKLSSMLNLKMDGSSS